MLFGVSDVVFQALIAGVVTIVLAYMQQKTKKAVDSASQNADDASHRAVVKAEEVKQALAKSEDSTTQKLNGLAKVAKATHTLVNSNMEIELKDNAELKRWKADRTGLPEDIRAAELAEAKYRDHQTKQAEVDIQATLDNSGLKDPTKG
jgi:Na+-translocating ferredoxin:NAD+ oxidoreductase RnfG subunit